MALIRSAFQDELDNISQSLVDLAEMVSLSMAKASTSILTTDLKLAEEVIASDDKIDSLQHDLDARIIDTIARQQPVASDLRALITALRMSSDLERMGDLAHHVAKICRMRHPESAVPAELLDIIKAMSSAAIRITEKIAVVISTRDIDIALEVDKDDDEVDELHRRLISKLTEPGAIFTIEKAIDLTLLGRYFERYSDHAVSVSQRVYFLVKGEFPPAK
jgi:phosphate transport system protein